MDTNDGSELEPSDESSEAKVTAENVASTGDAAAVAFILSGSYLGLVADIELGYEWAADSSQFWLTAYRTKVSSNKKNQGSLTIEILSGGARRWSASWDRMIGQTGGWNALPRKAGWGNVDNGQVTVKMEYTFDIGQLRPSRTASQDFFKPYPPNLNLIKNFAASPVRVTGTRGMPECNLLVHRNFDTVKTSGSIAADGTWFADLQLPVGKNQLSINANQSGGSAESGPSNRVYLYRAAITSPTENEVVPEKGLTFRGIAAPGTVMTAVRNGVGTPWSNTVNTGQGTTWAAAMLPNLGLGSGQISVIVEIDGNSQHYTYPVTFWLLGSPRITNTVFDVTVGFTLTGNNRLSGAEVTAYIGSSGTLVGTALPATTDAFSIQTDTKPGLIVITTQANHSGKSSGRSDGVTFRVAPRKPTLDYKVENGIGTLHGTGYGTAKVLVTGTSAFSLEQVV
uniref:hypothetical protein n=1 Tax=Pseudomonas sp. TWP3-1 TaxID=2804631 RepID=UPI003CF1FD43